MQRNPYSPPSTTDLEPSPPSEVAPRPVAVWLFLLWLLFLTVVFVWGVVRFIGVVAPHMSERNSYALIVAVAWRLGMVAGLVFTMIGIYRRGRWGRWLGVATIVVLAMVSVLQADHAQYPNEAQRAGAVAARLFIIPLLCAWWAYAFGFSSKAKRYFLVIND